MSGPKKLDHKRPRNFPQGPDETEEEQREEEKAAAQPPAARLYRHALESIFGFLSLADLSRVLSVSRSWCAAVSSMRSIDATISAACRLSSDLLTALLASRLCRHIGALNESCYHPHQAMLGQAELQLASVRLRGLRSLVCSLSLPIVGPFRLPPMLTQLDVRVPLAATADLFNETIRAAGACAKLSLFALSLYPKQIRKVSFAPLRSSPLQELRMLGVLLTFSQAQIDDLRAIPQLTFLNCHADAPMLRLLLRAPHQLQWEKLHVEGPVDTEMAGLLASLPSLTHLTAVSCNDVAFLRLLPNLRTLGLSRFAYHVPQELEELQVPEPAQMIQGLGQCAHVTHLAISKSYLTSAHLQAILSCMPALSQLELAYMRSGVSALPLLLAVSGAHAHQPQDVLLFLRANEHSS